MILRDFVKANLDKVDWDTLSYNPNASHMLEKNLDKVDWELLSLTKTLSIYWKKT